MDYNDLPAREPYDPANDPEMLAAEASVADGPENGTDADAPAPVQSGFRLPDLSQTPEPTAGEPETPSPAPAPAQPYGQRQGYAQPYPPQPNFPQQPIGPQPIYGQPYPPQQVYAPTSPQPGYYPQQGYGYAPGYGQPMPIEATGTFSLQLLDPRVGRFKPQINPCNGVIRFEDPVLVVGTVGPGPQPMFSPALPAAKERARFTLQDIVQLGYEGYTAGQWFIMLRDNRKITLNLRGRMNEIFVQKMRQYGLLR